MYGSLPRGAQSEDWEKGIWWYMTNKGFNGLNEPQLDTNHKLTDTRTWHNIVKLSLGKIGHIVQDCKMQRVICTESSFS